MMRPTCTRCGGPLNPAATFRVNLYRPGIDRPLERDLCHDCGDQLRRWWVVPSDIIARAATSGLGRDSAGTREVPAPSPSTTAARIAADRDCTRCGTPTSTLVRCPCIWAACEQLVCVDCAEDIRALRT